ncbi:hypothetical protein PTTG_29229 [Puccinia triticina 1-1 BBBD Race 1]|uniref:Uncharacterized protein n=1 Tax=Puccinia triticina (isolate 1-1 / race 1 (BBBD)) TaxID=630390 RepID=A0A180G5I3_PUCT1|nr:hypothetical protein PTTG_29229 [Puccinia triticina 1-1 BBBD Race 1]
MDLDHTWPAQDSVETELHFPQVIQPEYVIRDDDDVGFGSDSSGGHEAPSEYSDEFLSWDMFGESIIEQREEAITLAKAQDTRQAGGAPKVNWDPFNSEEDLIACLIMGYLHTLMSRVTYLQLRIILKMKKLALPYWDAVRNSRERIRKLLNFVNKESISVWDNKIFHISVKGILSNELLNPYVNGHLEFYPHDPCGDPIDSLCQSFKWREDLPRDIRVQMVHIESKHFYIQLAQKSLRLWPQTLRVCAAAARVFRSSYHHQPTANHCQITTANCRQITTADRCRITTANCCRITNADRRRITSRFFLNGTMYVKYSAGFKFAVIWAALDGKPLAEINVYLPARQTSLKL